MGDVRWQDVKHGIGPRDLRVEGRVLIEVDVEPTSTMVGGQPAKHGKQTLLVFRSELDDVRALVRTPDQESHMRACEKMHETDVKRFAKAKGMTLDRAARLIGPSDEYAGSPQAYFARAYPSGMPPLKSMRVLDEAVPAPDSPAARVEAQGRAQTDVMNKLTEVMERQGQVLERLAGRSQGGGNR